MEHMGCYYKPLNRVLSAANSFISAINPNLIKDFQYNTHLKVKSDKTDALNSPLYSAPLD